MYFGQFIGILVILEACILIKKKKKNLGGIFGCFSGLGGILVVLEVLGLFNDSRGNLVILVFYGRFVHFLLFRVVLTILVILAVFWSF